MEHSRVTIKGRALDEEIMLPYTEAASAVVFCPVYRRRKGDVGAP
jgi:hypothetical protein